MENEEQPKVKKEEERKTFLSEAQELATRNEKAVQDMRSLVERNEELAARNLLGGKSDAGIQPTAPVEETAKDYAKRISEGRL